MDAVYLDNNATTRPDPEVVRALLPWLESDYGNPSSLHFLGARASAAVARAREATARLLGAGAPGEVTFTSGGTEALHAAIHSALAVRPERTVAVTTAIEHSAVLEAVRALGERGYRAFEAPALESGALDLDALVEAVDDEAALAAVQLVNNETGVVHDLRPVAEACARHGVPLLVDAVQAAGKLPLDVGSLGADLVAISGHKLHGPKGVGALWIRPEHRFRPLLRGGPQEADRRAGTENVPAIVGLGAAARLAREHVVAGAAAGVAALRDRLESGLLERVPGAVVHGAALERAPNTTSVRFADVSAEAVVLLLSERGVCASTGSACGSGRQAPSHVLLAMGLTEAEASSTVRFSLSRDTRPEEIERALSVVPEVVAELRELLPSP